MTAQAADSVYKKLEKVGIRRSDKPIDNSVIAQVSGTQYRIISDIPNSAVTLSVTQFFEILSLINSLNENIDEHGKMIEEKKLKVANNGEVIVRIHKIRMKIGDITLPNEVRVAFAEHQVPELLLGRLDVFNHFEIHLKQDQLKTTMVSKISSVTPRPN